MKRLAEKGVIPAKFGKMSFPLCPWCIFGKQHRKPWRSSKKRVQIRRDDETAPGMCTSTDQLVSAKGGGLIPQKTGKLMSARYVGVCTILSSRFFPSLNYPQYYHMYDLYNIL